MRMHTVYMYIIYAVHTSTAASLAGQVHMYLLVLSTHALVEGEVIIFDIRLNANYHPQLTMPLCFPPKQKPFQDEKAQQT